MSGRIGRRVYRDKRWRTARRAVLARDGYRCSECRRSGSLEVHHRTKLEDGGAPFDLANLRALCRGCHSAEHNPIPPDVAAWREYVHGAR